MLTGLLLSCFLFSSHFPLKASTLLFLFHGKWGFLVVEALDTVPGFLWAMSIALYGTPRMCHSDSKEPGSGVWPQSPERHFSQPGGPSINHGGKNITGRLAVIYLSKRPRFENCVRRELPELVRESFGGSWAPQKTWSRDFWSHFNQLLHNLLGGKKNK